LHRDQAPEECPECERERVERHLRWCAGCRKEAGDLGAAAATVAFALTPARVPPTLEDRVVDRVRGAAAPRGRRRVWTIGSVAVAVVLAFAGLGWGAVMASRAERLQDRVAQAEQQRLEALRQFQHVLAPIFPGGDVPTNETHLAQLAPTADGQGGGAVLELVSPTMIDFSIVLVNGFDAAPDRLPYRVQLVDAAGDVLRAGEITSLDDEGGAEVYHQFDAKDLTGYTTVRVLDATGAIVLQGSVDQSD
jgi:hypothetical protein